MIETKPKYSVFSGAWKNDVGDWIITHEYGETMLEAIEKARVFTAEKQDNGTVEIREACDGFYYVRLRKDQILQLIDELKQIAEL
jgi:hypothetical protein